MNGWINGSIKGLFIKDMKLMKNQKQFFAIMILCAMGFINFFEPDFLVTYMGVMCMFFVLSTISYDEFDNGNAFLFSLPISRKDYVLEKYLFGASVGTGAWLLAVAVTTVYQIWRNPVFSISDWLITSCLLLLLTLFFMAVLLPIQLKFGGEKGKMVMMLVYGGIFALVVLIGKAIEEFHLDVEAFLHWLDNLDSIPVLLTAGLILAAALGLSYGISVKIVQKKEF